MTFVGKLVYLTLFPGCVFILLAGTLERSLARSIREAVPGLSYGTQRAFPASSLKSLARLLTGETVAVGGPLHAALWICPAVKVFLLSWISCIVFGFLEGDVFLLIILLIVYSSTDLLVCLLSGGSRVRMEFRRTAFSIIGWVAPLSLVLTSLALRASDPTVTGIIRWQVAYGSLLVSSEGGVLSQAGSIVALPVAFICFTTLAGFKPFGSRIFTYLPGDISGDFSGAPLAMLCSAETCGFFVMPLLLVAFFFAGPASNWLEILIWALKIAGAFALMSLLDYMACSSTRLGILYWLTGLCGSLAVVCYVLTWIGVGA